VTAATERDLPVIAFPSRAQWEAWLAAQPTNSKGLWLKLAKKTSGIAGVSRQEAIDAALCHGWIDGQLDKFDEDFWLIRFTPRKPRSKWSGNNRSRAIELMAEDRMTPAGLQEIERAQADGRWDAAYAPQSTAAVPDDLQKALDAAAPAKRLFEELDSTNRYAILYRVHNAKKPETRARRIETYVAMLARGDTLYPRKAKA
jgi:uncharacterized protein YdeI (YjbR/CyaY-like superfamily)